MRLLTLTLDMPLHAADIPGFRSAMVALAGPDSALFHGHNNAPGAVDPFVRDYPLVQYASRRGRATIIGLEEGAQALKTIILPQLPSQLDIAGISRPIGGFRVRDEELPLAVLDEPATFGLAGWMALNVDNFNRWKSDEGSQTRLEMLHRALTGQLRAFAERMQLPNYKAVEARVLRVDNQKRARWHGVDLVRFHVWAQANLLPPEGIHIGRAAAFGFGEVCCAEQYQYLLQSSRRRPEVL